jgi:hypothetical protein
METDAGKAFRLFGVSVDVTQTVPWVVAGLVFFAGLALFTLSLRPVRRAWENVNGELLKRGAL